MRKTENPLRDVPPERLYVYLITTQSAVYSGSQLSKVYKTSPRPFRTALSLHCVEGKGVRFFCRTVILLENDVKTDLRSCAGLFTISLSEEILLFFSWCCLNAESS